MEANESIIRKIEKCLALSKSSNEGEAAAALRQATKLMELYNVTPEALQAAQVGDAPANTDAWRRPPQWEMALVATLRTAFGCEAILNLGYSATKRLTVVRYIGLKHQAQLAAYAHDVLRRQVVKARNAYVSAMPASTPRGAKIAAGESFSRGYIYNISKQVNALANTPEQDAAIARLKAQLLGGEGRPYAPTQPGYDSAAAQAGRAAGARAALYRPMNGGAEQAKLTA